MKKRKPNRTMQAWIDARTRHGLSHVQAQMARATLTKTRAPTRKAELVVHILTFLEGDRLRTVWQCLAEVVHSPGTTSPAERFRAKYGTLPDFGSPSVSPAPHARWRPLEARP